MKRTALVFALALAVVFACLVLDRISPAGAAASSAQEAALPLPVEPGAPPAEARALSLADAPLPAQAAVAAVFLLFGVIAVFPLLIERPLPKT